MTDSPRDQTSTYVPSERAWTDDELRSLIKFRKRYGRRWKSKLLDLYLFGKDDSEPDGAGLRHIRNRQGPSRAQDVGPRRR